MRSARPMVTLPKWPQSVCACSPGSVFRAQIGLGLRARAVVRDQVAEVILSAAVTALVHHGIETAGGERRILLQGLAHERQVGIDQRRAMRPRGLRQTGLRQHPVDGGVVHAELPGNGADLPLLDVEVTQDLRFKFRGDRQGVVLLAIRAPPPNAHGLRARVIGGGGRSMAAHVGRRCRNPWRTNAEQRRPHR